MCPRNKIRNGLIIEIKVADKKEGLQERAKEALKQIIDKDYGRNMRAEGIKNILYAGVAFYREEVAVVLD